MIGPESESPTPPWAQQAAVRAVLAGEDLPLLALGAASWMAALDRLAPREKDGEAAAPPLVPPLIRPEPPARLLHGPRRHAGLRPDTATPGIGQAGLLSGAPASEDGFLVLPPRNGAGAELDAEEGAP